MPSASTCLRTYAQAFGWKPFSSWLQASRSLAPPLFQTMHCFSCLLAFAVLTCNAPRAIYPRSMYSRAVSSRAMYAGVHEHPALGHVSSAKSTSALADCTRGIRSSEPYAVSEKVTGTMNRLKAQLNTTCILCTWHRLCYDRAGDLAFDSVTELVGGLGLRVELAIVHSSGLPIRRTICMTQAGAWSSRLSQSRKASIATLALCRVLSTKAHMHVFIPTTSSG